MLLSLQVGGHAPPAPWLDEDWVGGGREQKSERKRKARERGETETTGYEPLDRPPSCNRVSLSSGNLRERWGKGEGGGHRERERGTERKRKRDRRTSRQRRAPPLGNDLRPPRPPAYLQPSLRFEPSLDALSLRSEFQFPVLNLRSKFKLTVLSLRSEGV